MEYVREKVAFDSSHRGYRFVATYLSEPRGKALIEIFEDDTLVRSMLWPDYKIWNIAAHAEDIVEGLEGDNNSGFQIAGSDGLGGNVFGGS